MDLDLASFDSVKKFVVGVEKNFGSVDVVINNAAIFVDDQPNVVTSTQDGLESYIGISHFGHFLLTSLLFPLIAKGGDIFLLHFIRFSLVANHFS